MSAWIGRDSSALWAVLRGALAAATLVFLIAPMVVVAIVSFSSAPFLQFPPPGFSLQWYAKLWSLPHWKDSLATSVKIMVPASLLATFIGTAAAVGLVRARFRGRALATGLIMAPLVVPVIITAAAILPLYRLTGLLGTYTGLILVHAMLALPYVVFTVTAALRVVDDQLESAAMTLGATRWQAFRLVTLPLILPAVLSGLIFSMVLSFDELVVTIFISSPEVRPIVVQMWSDVRGDVDPTIAAVGTLILGFSIAMLVLESTLRRWRRTPTLMVAPHSRSGRGP